MTGGLKVGGGIHGHTWDLNISETSDLVTKSGDTLLHLACKIVTIKSGVLIENRSVNNDTIPRI